MSTIAVSIVERPRKARRCEAGLHGREHERAEIQGPHVRIFGRASSQDSPYAVYVCLKCAERVALGERRRELPLRLRKVDNALAARALAECRATVAAGGRI